MQRIDYVRRSSLSHVPIVLPIRATTLTYGTTVYWISQHFFWGIMIPLLKHVFPHAFHRF